MVISRLESNAVDEDDDGDTRCVCVCVCDKSCREVLYLCTYDEHALRQTWGKFSNTVRASRSHISQHTNCIYVNLCTHHSQCRRARSKQTHTGGEDYNMCCWNHRTRRDNDNDILWLCECGGAIDCWRGVIACQWSWMHTHVYTLYDNVISRVLCVRFFVPSLCVVRLRCNDIRTPRTRV